ncbi:DUF397 domain-containing protein [Kitasatospora sp. NPDC001574]
MVEQPADGKRPVAEEELAGAQWLGVEGEPDGPQIAVLPDGYVVMRHGASPDGPKLVYTAEEWDAFLLGAADGEFDNLAEQEIAC